MALKAISTEPASDWKSSAWVVFIWVIWLSFIRHLPFPSWIHLPMTILILLFGAMVWNLLMGGLILILVSWIYHYFSITPPGLYWLSLMIVFLGLKIAISQLSLKGPLYILTLLIVGALFLDFFQLYFLSRTVEEIGLSWFLFLGIFVSAIAQGFLGLIFSGPLMERSQMR